jgi:hypothetical protein
VCAPVRLAVADPLITTILTRVFGKTADDDVGNDGTLEPLVEMLEGAVQWHVCRDPSGAGDVAADRSAPRGSRRACRPGREPYPTFFASAGGCETATTVASSADGGEAKAG